MSAPCPRASPRGHSSCRTVARLSADVRCVGDAQDESRHRHSRRQRMQRSYWLAAALGLSLTGAASAEPPAPPAQPAQTAPPTAPWANKFFLPGIGTNRNQPAPTVIEHNF